LTKQRRREMVVTKILNKEKEIFKTNSYKGNYVVFCKVLNYSEENKRTWEYPKAPYYFWRKKDAQLFITQ